MDHWVITLSKQSVSQVTARGASFEVPAGLPFILSFGEEISINRKDAEGRLQLILARDSFQAIAPILDAARYRALNTPAGRMLADYMLLLERHMPTVEAATANRLNNAVQSMLVACLAPSGEKAANDQVKFTLMERVRQAVHRNLRSPSLGPAKLCSEAATSRSQLYRLLEDEGGVARYIQRRRLAESFSMLCDIESGLPIAKIAEALCFSDASAFSRAFRREFGMSPRDVRAGAHAGLAPAAAPSSSEESHPFRFKDCLRGG
jgi:AraC-like DNA-binding protein